MFFLLGLLGFFSQLNWVNLCAKKLQPSPWPKDAANSPSYSVDTKWIQGLK